jgi:hypothetical protein
MTFFTPFSGTPCMYTYTQHSGTSTSYKNKMDNENNRTPETYLHNENKFSNAVDCHKYMRVHSTAT